LFISSGLVYLIGNIQTAYFLGKWTRNIDIRDPGTANAGASNVTITPGLGYGIFTFLVYAAKGFLAVFLVRYFWPTESTMALLAGFFAILGHIYPVAVGSIVVFILLPFIAYHFDPDPARQALTMAVSACNSINTCLTFITFIKERKEGFGDCS
jgi:hypothetical protein